MVFILAWEVKQFYGTYSHLNLRTKSILKIKTFNIPLERRVKRYLKKLEAGIFKK